VNSIGPHFYALAPSEQARRIVAFCEALWTGEGDLSLGQSARAIRLALRSMSPAGRFSGVVRARPQFILIEGPGYTVSTAPEATFIVSRGGIS
jgi:hypothetical protein